MSEITRRGALGIALGAAAAPLMPPAALALPPAAPAVAALLPAWQVGWEDSMSWRVIFAETAERAMQIYREQDGLCDGCDGLRCGELDTEYDCAYSSLETRPASAKVIPPSEAEGEHPLTDEEMTRLGWAHHCDRHNDVCEEWQVVERDGKREIVCNDCMDPIGWTASTD